VKLKPGTTRHAVGSKMSETLLSLTGLFSQTKWQKHPFVVDASKGCEVREAANTYPCSMGTLM